MAKKVDTTTRYTWKDVAKHNMPGDVWVAIEGKVYDVTSWAERHPGGSEYIYLAAGTPFPSFPRIFPSIFTLGGLEELSNSRPLLVNQPEARPRPPLAPTFPSLPRIFRSRFVLLFLSSSSSSGPQRSFPLSSLEHAPKSASFPFFGSKASKFSSISLF